MSCGESGFAICAFAERWPEAREALALAALGVIETLERVAPEGDWPEGVGYWFATLFMGLRLAVALRRLSGGEVNLFEHPALKNTGDFAAMLTTPGARVYNFNDNGEKINGYASEAVLMLAVHSGRRDWLAAARTFPTDSVLWLALDDPALRSEPPKRTAFVFPRTGVATARSGWGPADSFVGFKCGPSDVGHSHLDANSFIVESRGVPLVIDEGTWPYAHYLGFFEVRKLRWNWDNLATVGHSTLLIDGKGQSWGPDCAGRIVAVESGQGWHRFVGDAGRCYPDTLTKFIRTLLFLMPDLLVVRDVVQCKGERTVEWLLHYAGTIKSSGQSSVVESDGVRTSVTPFLPDRSNGWRVGDVTGESTYEDSNALAMVTRTIRYRSFTPFRAAESFEFVFGLAMGESKPEDLWQLSGKEGEWTLRLPGRRVSLVPSGDSVSVQSVP